MESAPDGRRPPQSGLLAEQPIKFHSPFTTMGAPPHAAPSIDNPVNLLIYRSYAAAMILPSSGEAMAAPGIDWSPLMTVRCKRRLTSPTVSDEARSSCYTKTTRRDESQDMLLPGVRVRPPRPGEQFGEGFLHHDIVLAQIAWARLALDSADQAQDQLLGHGRTRRSRFSGSCADLVAPSRCAPRSGLFPAG